MKKYSILYDLNDPDPPKIHEQHAARIMADFFQSDLVFIRKTVGCSPDLKVKMTGQVWELKSPLGNGKRTISNNLRDASHQSENIILDLTRCKMSNMRAISRIHGFLNSGDAKIKRLLVIDKSKKVIDFFVQKR